MACTSEWVAQVLETGQQVVSGMSYSQSMTLYYPKVQCTLRKNHRGNHYDETFHCEWEEGAKPSESIKAQTYLSPMGFGWPAIA